MRKIILEITYDPAEGMRATAELTEIQGQIEVKTKHIIEEIVLEPDNEVVNNIILKGLRPITS